MSRSSLPLIILTVASFTLSARAQDRPVGIFAIVYAPGPAWLKDKPIAEQPLRDQILPRDARRVYAIATPNYSAGSPRSPGWK